MLMQHELVYLIHLLRTFKRLLQECKTKIMLVVMFTLWIALTKLFFKFFIITICYY